jgi:hypothetical protein
MTYTTAGPLLVIEDDLTVQYDETPSPLPRRPVRRTDGVA